MKAEEMRAIQNAKELDLLNEKRISEFVRLIFTDGVTAISKEKYPAHSIEVMVSSQREVIEIKRVYLYSEENPEFNTGFHGDLVHTIRFKGGLTIGEWEHMTLKLMHVGENLGYRMYMYNMGYRKINGWIRFGIYWD